MPMKPTTYATISINPVSPIPGFGALNPTVLAKAAMVPVRVVVRNISAGVFFVSGDTGDVNPQNGPSTGAFRVEPQREEVFVLAPGDGLYAVAAGAGVSASIGVSEATPFDFRS